MENRTYYRIHIDDGNEIIVCGDGESVTEVRDYLDSKGVDFRNIEQIDFRIPHFSRIDSLEQSARWTKQQYDRV